MYFEITTTHRPATDLGYLLHKNPGRSHVAELPFGRVHMVYLEASDACCRFALILDVDPIALVRGPAGGAGNPPSAGPLEPYVNDRPYAASSFLSVAIAQGLRSALGGRCKERPQLAQTPIPLEAMVTPLQVRGDAGLVKKLFEPLGYVVAVEPIPLDPVFSEWGASTYVTLRLQATVRLADLLSHLYVLIPVLDLKKHYFLDAAEIDKLIVKGGEWLPNHPAREQIARRYLSRKRSLANEAVERLAALREDAEVAGDGTSDADAVVAAVGGDLEGADAEGVDRASPEASVMAGASKDAVVDEDGIPLQPKEAAEIQLEKPIRLHDLRLERVFDVIRESGAKRVLDLGCGSGKLMKRLAKAKQFTEIVGLDVGHRDLEAAARRLRLDTLPERQRERFKLLQGALTYHDMRLAGYDAAAMVEVIEHVDPERLAHVERVVFEKARPGLVVVTTPNREYNIKFEGLAVGKLRHADHRFEWSRAEFAGWTQAVADRFGYRVRIEPLGEVDSDLGPPSQMAVFERGGMPA